MSIFNDAVQDWVEFSDIEINQEFKIPSGINHEFESFIKLNHGKAKSLEDGRICHFGNEFSVWVFE